MSYFPEVVMLVKLPQDVCSLFFFFFPNVTLCGTEQRRSSWSSGAVFLKVVLILHLPHEARTSKVNLLKCRMLCRAELATNVPRTVGGRNMQEHHKD